MNQSQLNSKGSTWTKILLTGFFPPGPKNYGSWWWASIYIKKCTSRVRRDEELQSKSEIRCHSPPEGLLGSFALPCCSRSVKISRFCQRAFASVLVADLQPQCPFRTSEGKSQRRCGIACLSRPTKLDSPAAAGFCGGHSAKD